MTLAFQSGMEQEASHSYNQVAQKGDCEDLIVSIAAATDDALDTQPHKQEICQGVDNLRRIHGRIVVLEAETASSV